MMEVKAEKITPAADAVAALRGDVAALRARVEVQEGAMLRAGRLPVEGTKSTSDAARRTFVDRYLRAGQDVGVELKALTGLSGASGGYAIPREIDAVIAQLTRQASPIRALARVVATGSSGYRQLVALGGTPSGWVSEAAPRPETTTPDFAEVAPPFGELYANPAASQAMLDDAAFDVEAWLAEGIAREFARAEGAAFVNGTGTNMPRGFLTYATSTDGDGTRPFGTLQYVPSGAAGGFAASNPEDRLIDLIHALQAGYRQGASFVMASDVLARIRKMKSADGAFLWQPGLAAGQPDSLLGYPVVEVADMPGITPGSLSIAFGDFQAAYLVADHAETSILRDPYSNKPFVHFYATKRVGGAIVNSDAIKLMKFAAS